MCPIRPRKAQALRYLADVARRLPLIVCCGQSFWKLFEKRKEIEEMARVPEFARQWRVDEGEIKN